VVIEAKGLKKSFGDKLLFEDLSFSLPPGGIVVFEDNFGGSVFLQVTIEADIVKQKQAETRDGYNAIKFGKTHKKVYSELTPGDHPIEMTRYQIANCFMGRAPLINSGGASSGESDFADAVRTAVVNKRAGGRTLGSATMPYTGVILLLFVIYHLFNFHFVDKTHTTIFQIVSNAFAQPGYVLIYTFAMIIAAVHVSHGFWSAFQTLGANHPKYTPLLRGLSIVFSLIVGIGFGFIPVYVSLLV